jgi:hypothetical protein
MLLEKTGNTYKILVPSGSNVGKVLTDLHVESSMIVDIEIKEGSLEQAFLRVLKTPEKSVKPKEAHT